MLADMGSVSSVFRFDHLVLLWQLDPTEQTIEGVTVGSPLRRAWLAYPDAQALRPAPAASPNALLVSRPDRSYLIRHDGSSVRRILVGTEELLRAAYDHEMSSV